MYNIFPNEVENAIIQTLAHYFPLTAKEIHTRLVKNGHNYSYKYIYKLLNGFVDKEILEKDGLSYKLNKKFISHLKHFTSKVSDKYRMYQNVFTDTIKSDIISVLDKKDQKALQKQLNELIDKTVTIKLAEWYEDYYDPEDKEFKQLEKIGKLKGKKVLELGGGTGRLTFKIAKKAESVHVIEKDQTFIDYCKKRNPSADNITYQNLNIEDLDKVKDEYDVIVSGWAGIHYTKDMTKIIDQFHRLLKKNGTLIVIEAYFDSDYVQILNHIRPRNMEKSAYLKNELKKNLFDKFQNVEEKVIYSHYDFPNLTKLEEAFKIELMFEEGTTWSKEDSKKFYEFINKFKDPLKISDSPMFLSCVKEK